MLTDRIIVAGIWSDPLYINASSLSVMEPSPSGGPSPSSDEDDDVPAFAYYIIGFGLGLIIAVVILIAVFIFCCNLRDRWYDKSECVSTRYLTISF